MVFCAFTTAALQHASDLSSPWKLNRIPIVRKMALCSSQRVRNNITNTYAKNVLIPSSE